MYVVTGTVTGYTGDGSGIAVGVHRVDTGELIGSAATSVGGWFYFEAADDTTALFVQARQSDTLVGRSDDSPAVSEHFTGGPEGRTGTT